MLARPPFSRSSCRPWTRELCRLFSSSRMEPFESHSRLVCHLPRLSPGLPWTPRWKSYHQDDHHQGCAWPSHRRWVRVSRVAVVSRFFAPFAGSSAIAAGPAHSMVSADGADVPVITPVMVAAPGLQPLTPFLVRPVRLVPLRPRPKRLLMMLFLLAQLLLWIPFHLLIHPILLTPRLSRKQRCLTGSTFRLPVPNLMSLQTRVRSWLVKSP